MYIVSVNLEDVSKEFEFINSWIDTICENILHKEKDSCKINIFYNYGYFVKKGQGPKEEQYKMVYDDRLEYEISKVRVNVTIKIDDFMMTNRLKKGTIPDIIKSMVTEITKYKMDVEFEYHGLQSIKDSIPEYDNSVISVEVIRQELKPDDVNDEVLDLDDILDKIAKNGIDSLSNKERDFLDNKSKEM
jgi:hypothetical protein